MLDKVLAVYNSNNESGIVLVSKSGNQKVTVSPSYFRWENKENNHKLEIEDRDIETISYYVSNTEWVKDMKREDYAKIINWKGTATRGIKTNEVPDYEIGQIINPGLCWTDGGEFRVETNGDYSVIFVIENEVEGHKVAYENEQECEDLGCEDCWGEKEILINKNFVVTDFWAWDEETQFAKVFLKEVI